MSKSVRKYMIIDLAVLALIGCVLEAIITKFIGFVLDSAPTITLSLLIVFIAVARWKAWGLLLIPLLAFSTLLGGQFSDMAYFRAFYSLKNWQLYLSIVLGLSTMSINLVFFRKHRTNDIVGTIWKCLLLLILDYVLYCGVQFVFYRLFTAGTLTQQAVIEFEWYEINEYGNKVYSPKNLAYYGENGIIYNLFGLAIAMIGALVLRSQGVLNNAVDKLVEDKKARDAELEYLNSFGNEKWDTPIRINREEDESNKEKKQDSSK